MATINRKVLTKNFTTTPSKITPTIERLCAEINANESPIFVPVKPDLEAISSECFHNVSKKVERDGGSILYGWNLWEWSRVFVEAEHHAVWVKDGELTDVTPKQNRERKILFLPDPSRTYDFANQKRLINIKRSLRRYPSVESWIKATDDFQNAVERNSVGDQASFSQFEMHHHQEAIMNAMLDVILDLAADTKPRERCICASGKEFRKCCSKHIQFWN
ncbi:hypothetical protein [Tritonibacter mobilis]|uniref:hypothetical protein n=1 Tax=Tritonibacter mobilis TaxID=379347 RepID=UPI001CDA2385|nr:hypothetical protein [Tritonibacter mobilis]MCA2007951.1 hypothetical protein [Tritonibacter mobilis]